MCLWPDQIPAKLFSRPKDDVKIEKFLEFFYKQCIHALVRPILSLPVFKEPDGTSSCSEIPSSRSMMFQSRRDHRSHTGEN